MNREKGTSIDKVRVIGIFAHVDAGKTTTSEGILYYTGRIHRIGSVDDGNTQLDWMTQERERGITVTAAATTCHWRGHQVNLIDTPGHIDFSAEVVRSIRVIDGTIILLCGVGGVEAQTSSVWMHADRENLPRIIFVNKLDRLGADFDRVLAEVHEQLTPHAVALQIPIGSEGDFTGVVDLISQRALLWHDGSEEPTVESIPPSMKAQAALARTQLLEAVCETDDELLEQWLEGHETDEVTLRSALRRATITSKLIPVVCGSALNRIGIQPLLDAIVAYLPSPLDVQPARNLLPISIEEFVRRPDAPNTPLCAAAFKIVTDPYVGHLTWVRVFSGHLKVGETVYNPRADVQERVGRIYRIHANQREQVNYMTASDVVALVGVKSAITGDTLCDPDYPVKLETFEFPEPVIMVALTPSADEERDRLHQAVIRLANEEPTLIASFDPETGEETLAGMGELHLEIAVDRLRTEYGIIPEVSKPQVSYRESIRRRAETTSIYKKQTGGHGHFARVRLRVEPLGHGKGVAFENEASAFDIPTGFVRHIELGAREALEKGVIAGYPITDVRITLLGGRYHVVDSSGKDFQLAGSMAARQAVLRAQPALLEPIMQIDVNVEQEHLGVVTADINRRRGSVKSMDVRGNVHSITGEVPLAETHGYATDIRNITQGRGTFTLEFRRYSLVPENIAEDIINQRRLDGKIPKR